MSFVTYTNKVNIGVLGTGDVGKQLSKAFLTEGNPTMIGTRDVNKAEVVAFKTANPAISIGTFEETVKFADIVVLAVGGAIAQELVKSLASVLSGKVVIDAVNPITPGVPPKKFALQYFTEKNSSLMELLIEAAPEAHFVKAFNSVGNGLMYKPQLSERASMIVCGDSDEAKKSVQPLIEAFGWDFFDVGASTLAGPVEALCPLWCAIAFKTGKFNDFAFKIVTK
ncbi:NADP oxidoreductase [Heterostelium album PN500]|uniref:NADP oxidoreductase n=1 Tax=Heterostelium pallidum (strain ATCC 26659 / Pp 5 / PN500) TaxID=670386 RepID=D3B669_HETP5|nr:NADP oxidoreductase [Heterostelium album PN500]EFA83367.1 NADP oxidoreductase [Heterostelium album PN500]|eukprot:XP_020435484.1 NADP oxidoreductase [Heterostelium album PN500]